MKQYGNLTQLTRLFAFNAYLLREADGLTLIDTGLPGSAPQILAAAKALNAPIRRILITHAHNDHVASLDALVAELPDAEVMSSARTARFLAGERSLDPDEAQDVLRGGYTTVATRPTRFIEDGDVVGALRVVASPGHTPGHLSFLDERDGTLIAGDAFHTQAGLAVTGTMRLLFPFPAMATWHKPSALASAKRLLALKPSRLATGHGRVLENPAVAMAAAIAEAERKFAS